MAAREPSDRALIGSESWRSKRARLAHAARFAPEADQTDLRRDLKAERASDYVRRLVAEAPPLTELQCARLAALLLGAPAGGAKATRPESKVDEEPPSP